MLWNAEDDSTSDMEYTSSDALRVRNRLIKVTDNGRSVKPRTRFIFMLQAPIMLLTFSVMTYLAGLCSVVFSPLGMDLHWDSNAKNRPRACWSRPSANCSQIAMVFGVTSLLTIAVFVSTSKLV